MDKITVYLRSDQVDPGTVSKQIEYVGEGVDYRVLGGDLHITFPKQQGTAESRSTNVAHWVRGSWSGFDVSADGLTVSGKTLQV